MAISANIFKVNQRMTLMFSRRPNAEQFQSRIEEITPQNMVIAMPMSKGQPVLASPGTKFIGKVAIAGMAYFFTSAYIEKKSQPIPIWIISLPADIEKIQQRSFVRMDIMLPVEVVMPSEEEESSDGTKTVNVSTKDIGGGGTQLILTEPVQIGTKLQLAINIPEVGFVKVNGEVIRVEKPIEDRELFWIGVKFLDIREPIRNKVIKFIFKKQLELRQKGV